MNAGVLDKSLGFTHYASRNFYHFHHFNERYYAMKHQIQQFVKHVQHQAAEATRAIATLLRPITRHLTLRNWVKTFAAMAAMFALTEPAIAALPTALDPGGSGASGDYLALMQAYWKKGVAVLVLIVGALAFLSVGGGAVAKFNEYRAGKAELGDLTMYAVLGVILLIITVYLLTTSDGIIT